MSVFKKMRTASSRHHGPERSVNAMNEEYRVAMAETVDKLEQEEGLPWWYSPRPRRSSSPAATCTSCWRPSPVTKAQFMDAAQRQEQACGAWKTAGAGGGGDQWHAALGGGFEICLCCNHRIAWDDKSVQLALRVTLVAPRRWWGGAYGQPAGA